MDREEVGLTDDDLRLIIDALNVAWADATCWGEFGGNPDDAKAYTEMLKVSYTEIKKIDPNAIVVSAGLSPTTEQSDRAISDTVFLKDMYANGAKAYFDMLGVHASGFKAAPDIDPGTVAASTSTLSRPMPARPTTTRSAPASSTSAVTCVAERMMRASAPFTASSRSPADKSRRTSTSHPAARRPTRPRSAISSVTRTRGTTGNSTRIAHRRRVAYRVPPAPAYGFSARCADFLHTSVRGRGPGRGGDGRPQGPARSGSSTAVTGADSAASAPRSTPQIPPGVVR